MSVINGQRFYDWVDWRFESEPTIDMKVPVIRVSKPDTSVTIIREPIKRSIPRLIDHETYYAIKNQKTRLTMSQALKLSNYEKFRDNKPELFTKSQLINAGILSSDGDTLYE